MRLFKRILGSICSVLAGWLACTLLWMLGVLVFSIVYDPARALLSALTYGLYVGAICGIFALGTWIVAFLWLYLFLPASSRLWVWWRAGLTGGLVGSGIILLVSLLIDQNIESVALFGFVPSAFVTGGVAACFAAVTRGRFHN